MKFNRTITSMLNKDILTILNDFPYVTGHTENDIESLDSYVMFMTSLMNDKNIYRTVTIPCWMTHHIDIKYKANVSFKSSDIELDQDRYGCRQMFYRSLELWDIEPLKLENYWTDGTIKSKTYCVVNDDMEDEYIDIPQPFIDFNSIDKSFIDDDNIIFQDFINDYINQYLTLQDRQWLEEYEEYKPQLHAWICKQDLD